MNNPVFAPSSDKVQICNYCEAPVVNRLIGKELFTFCSNDCGCLEGETPIYRYPCSCGELLGEFEECSCGERQFDKYDN